MRRIHFDAVDSTNVQARRLAAEHPGEALVVTAAEQTAGRGRRGRSWLSPRGGAWLSIVWPLRQPAATAAGVSLAAAVAVRRAICALAPDAADRLLIKWPNDLLLDDQKVVGILCEQITPAGDQAGGGALIVGVGVNVDFDTTIIDGQVRTPSTTLAAALGAQMSVDAVIESVTRELLAALEIFESVGLSATLLAELRDRLAYVGSVRTWMAPTGPIRGRVLGVDDAGRLLLAGPHGTQACETGELGE